MDDSSEDVNEFLLRIRELGDKRVKEDEDRARKLEEEILQGRKERQARRAERARSISPTKDFPSPSISSLPRDHKSISQFPPQVLRPTSASYEQDNKTHLDEHHVSDNNSPSTPPVVANHVAQSDSDRTEDTLDQAIVSEKISSLSLEPTATGEQTNETMPLAEDTPPSRSQISKNLSSKDPAWFRQTADRDRGSLALRRNADTSTTETSSAEASFKLPGLSRDSASDAEKFRDWIADERSRSPSRASSTFAANSSIGNRYSSISSVSTSGLGSPIPLVTSRLEARKIEAQPPGDDRIPLSPGRASPERSGSPTKGLGGFVQSAMLKRSDSISKRWTVQSPANLSRSNSIISNRSGVGRSAFGDLLPSPAEPRPIRESSPLSLSRPGSSHSEATIVHHSKSPEDKDSSQEKPPLDTGFVRPSLPIHARSSFSNATGADEAKASDEPQTPRSPSKSFDQKRWSPTKSSWLESALNRPESPRTKATPVTQQPAWMRDLSKARQSRASIDLGRPAAAQETTPVSLRSPALSGHSKSPSVSGISSSIIQDLNGPSTEKVQSPKKEENTQPAVSDTKDGVEAVSKEVDVSASPDVEEKLSSSLPKTSPPVPSNKPKTVSAINVGSANPRSQPVTTDFRANLRKREVTNDKTTQDEPEFKNIFGKLRKAEKSTYKVPDVLKDNITKGKAALIVTGGPKKSDRVDEFRESILKQKDAMKAGGGSIRKTGDEDRNIPKPRSPVPEALAKRNNLARTDSTRSNLSVLSSPSPTNSTGTESPQRPLSVSSNKPELNLSPVEPSPRQQSTTIAITPNESSTQYSKINVQKRETVPGPNSVPAKSIQENKIGSTGSTVRPLSSRATVDISTKITTEPKGLATKGAIAGRLNPALADILARGPPRAGGESGKPTVTTSTFTPTQEPQPTSTAPLTHMTKARARGPKRRLPASTKSESITAMKEDSQSTGQATSASKVTERKDSSEEVRSPSVPAKTLDNRSESVIERQKPLIPSKSPDVPRSSLISPPKTKPVAEEPSADKENQEVGVKSSASPESPTEEVSKPPVPSKSADVRRVSMTSPTLRKTSTSSLNKEKSNDLPSKSTISPVVPPKTGIVRDTSTLSDKKRSLNERPTPPPKLATLPLNPSPGNSSPSPSFASRLKETFSNSANVSPIQAKFGLGLGGSFFQSRPGSPLDTSRKPSPANKPPSTPPVPPKKNLSISAQIPTEVRRPSLMSPIPRTSESVGVISEFFDTPPKSSDRVNVDPQLILSTETDEFKTRTLRKQIWEITGDGKKQDLPKNQDYILFEGSMYVCVHSFECETGNTTECYLWLGDEVSEAAMQDAQLFARRVARENGTKLEIIRQGKEPAKFVEALGGIIITRRGSSSRSSSSALYMLCGRRHLGQIAFDEVDFCYQNLCSGFTFVISARFGKLYLWKGKGSGADEVGSARLVGMDLGLTGEMEEISEGDEPQSFFDVFPKSETVEPPTTSDYWHLKPKHEKHRYRLLRIDHVLGQKGGFWNRRGSSSPVIRPNDTIREIEPFSQKDLLPQGIYILDAFFEIYVIVGSEAKSRAAEFASALVFAHEYGILAASLQDRPFIPVGYVSIGGLPDSCTVAFRKWDPRLWPTTSYVLPLNAAIEAIRS
ncbi:gelsolin repeat protein, putative [Talaromyces stipitatus ATCC 10500]|uniref:Gelsolin repeat protein, putative n=1 Tax=Talaromyces stipitatus (strain ATCC 10500 / CBS 375.48 / QM 6759 / NRRL 1006) TaxID=441959 RepID=B8M2X4_TALSN|nr:gelsolin repeat protein, putative [Talaromyces stipitatus ATCC 10500]EED22229.1 gelsolin repeat protein, putative [Talaromyces stipitatus ATCC 10500]